MLELSEERKAEKSVLFEQKAALRSDLSERIVDKRIVMFDQRAVERYVLFD